MLKFGIDGLRTLFAVLIGCASLTGGLLMFEDIDRHEEDRAGFVPAFAAALAAALGIVFSASLQAALLCLLVPLFLLLRRKRTAGRRTLTATILAVMAAQLAPFGVLKLAGLLREAPLWGSFLLPAGIVFLLMGAAAALLTVDLRAMLACTAVSQLGYVLAGAGLMLLHGGADFAVRGALLAAVSFTFSLLPFALATGVVCMSLRTADLNEALGFGRRKPLLHACFLAGMLGVMGVPPVTGFVSVTLLHEAILKAAGALASQALLGQAYLLTIAEWALLFSIGLTAAQMIRLYIALFWEKNPRFQPGYDAFPPLQRTTRAALAGAGTAALLTGLRPRLLIDVVTWLAGGVLGAERLTEPIRVFSAGNLKSAGISLVIGLVVYLAAVRPLLIGNIHGKRSYLGFWPGGKGEMR